jgi:hypothetical protein
MVEIDSTPDQSSAAAGTSVVGVSGSVSRPRLQTFVTESPAGGVWLISFIRGVSLGVIAQPSAHLLLMLSRVLY